MNIMANLKNAKFGVALPACILSLVGFVSALVGVTLYSSNCASEFNGGVVSGNVVSLGTAAIILAGIAMLGMIVSLFLAKSEKIAYFCSYVRFANFGAFVLSLGAFFFQILDEYSLIGTILYPIVSGAVGDPVDPKLSGSYFSALGLLIIAMIVSMVAGCLVSNRAKKLLAEEAK